MNDLGRSLFPALLASCSLFVACATGNDNLAAGGAGAGAGTSSGAAGAGGAGGAEDAGIPIEPNGPPKLTLVNGINDYDAIRLCFVPWPDGGDPPPIPADANGLAFGAALVVDPQSAAIPAGKDLWVHAIAGDLAKTAGKNCNDLTAGAGIAGVVVAPIAVIPAAAFSAERSLLVVPNGCMGGPGHTDPLEKQACGETYSPDTPYPGLLAAGMSRLTKTGVISIQAAHAAPGMPPVDVRMLPGIEGAMPNQIAPSLTLGEVGPFPPSQKLSRIKLGSLAETQIGTFAPNQFNQSSASPLLDALARGGIDQTDFDDGQGFTLVGIGAAPGLPAGAFWHALTWTVVRSDP